MDVWYVCFELKGDTTRKYPKSQNIKIQKSKVWNGPKVTKNKVWRGSNVSALAGAPPQEKGIDRCVKVCRSRDLSWDG